MVVSLEIVCRVPKDNVEKNVDSENVAVKLILASVSASRWPKTNMYVGGRKQRAKKVVFWRPVELFGIINRCRKHSDLFHGSYSELIQLKRFRLHRCHCSPPGCRLPVLLLAVNAAAKTSDFHVAAGGKNNNCIGSQTLPNGGEACESSSDAMKHNFRPRPLRGRRAEPAKLSVRLDRSDGSCTSTPGN